jgi:hypothetical protein
MASHCASVTWGCPSPPTAKQSPSAYSSPIDSSLTKIGLPRGAVAAAAASAGRSRLSSCGLIGASSLQTAASKPVHKAENRLDSQGQSKRSNRMIGSRAHAGRDQLRATVLFTCIVGSMKQAVALGDRNWLAQLSQHHSIVRQELVLRSRERHSLDPASFVDFEQGIARTHNCAGERPRRSHVIS